MKCHMCDYNKALKKSRTTVKYKECGLDNVTLVGVEHYKCDKCGEDYFGYGNIEQLHQLIAQVLLKKSGLLDGKEVRFLRKTLGYSGAMFSKLLGYDSATISRIETGAQTITPTFDHLVRFAVATKLPNREYNLHDQILKESGEKFNRIELTSTAGGDWKAKLAA